MPEQLSSLIPMVHAGATWFMVGLIWFVQVVHYPLFAEIPADCVPAYAKTHQRRTGWIVGPVMLVEAVSALFLLFTPPRGFAGSYLPAIGVALLALVWLSTFAVQVPLHERLASAFDRDVWRRLVVTNVLRTIAWTARGILALALLQ